MINFKKEAMRVAQEVSVKFESEFGFKPIIGGSLSLILHGYIPMRYRKVTEFKLNDVDVVVEDRSVLQETIINPVFTRNIIKNMIEQGLNPEEQIINGEELSIPNVNYIGDFAQELRLEVYPMNTDVFIGDDPRWVWINDIKVQNPMLALNAKAGYILEELGQHATTEDFQELKNKRISKHYKDIVDSQFDIKWNYTEDVKVIKHHMFQNIIAEYISAH